MATKRSAPAVPQRHAEVSLATLPNAIRKLKKRLEEVQAITPRTDSDFSPLAQTIAEKVNATFSEIYGADTVEAAEAKVMPRNFQPMFAPCSSEDKLRIFNAARSRVVARLQATIEIFEERYEDSDEDNEQRTLRAYGGLDLHPEIARAATELYRDGHYANAVADAVKALNGLVRMRSGEELDGSTLMERVFAPKNPILRFNDMADQSDTDEQKGFMMMFAGAVAGLRNPRAHKFIQDDPERALEFIAYVSLLAKLLDGAKKA